MSQSVKLVPFDQFVKQLREQVRVLKREHKYLDTQIERCTRYAPPYGENLKHVRKLERELMKVEKQMDKLCKVVSTFPNALNSFM